MVGELGQSQGHLIDNAIDCITPDHQQNETGQVKLVFIVATGARVELVKVFCWGTAVVVFGVVNINLYVKVNSIHVLITSHSGWVSVTCLLFNLACLNETKDILQCYVCQLPGTPRSESLVSTDLFYYYVSLSGYCNTVNVIHV